MELMQMAVDLGEELLKTPQYLEMKDSEAVYLSDEEALCLVSEYNKKRMDTIKLINEKSLSQEEAEPYIAELTAHLELFEQNTVISNYNKASEKFNNLLKSVTDMIDYTVNGEVGGCEGCGSKCSGDKSQCGHK